MPPPIDAAASRESGALLLGRGVLFELHASIATLRDRKQLSYARGDGENTATAPAINALL